MERRQFARIQINLRLRFKSFSQLEQMLEGAAGDLSEGGMFIRTEEVKPVGTQVEMELPLPEGGYVCLRGQVRSVRYDRGRPLGMGIQFEKLEGPARRVILYLLGKGNQNQCG